MGLFSSHKHAQENIPPAGTTVTTTSSTPHGGGPGLFGKRKSVSNHPPPSATQPVEPPTTNKSGGLLSRKRTPTDLRGFSKYDTLHAARTKLEAAQQAETAADAALVQARAAVKEARAEILALEREAEGEAADGVLLFRTRPACFLRNYNPMVTPRSRLQVKSLRVAGDKLGRHS
ncbi:hypothetical protein JCM3770_000299 [Rhodotorula araucariae]